MTDSYKPDRPVICPYNSDHSIAQSRLHRHLIKCSKNYPPGYRITCRYNATHRLPKDEIDQHIFNCPDRKYFDPKIYESNRTHGALKSCFDVDNSSTIDYDESWDDEEDNFLEAPRSTPVPRLMNDQIMCKPSVANFEPPGSTVQFMEPKGLATATTIDQSIGRIYAEESGTEDRKSVKSFMGIGHGKKMWPNLNDAKKIELTGRARGSSQTKDMYF